MLLLRIVMIAAVAWSIIGAWRVLESVVLSRYRLDVEDNLAARRIHTQLRVLRRVVTFVTGVIAFSVMLTLFPGVRQLGASLLASAGIAGLVLGIAARPALANLIASLQIALAQPIRLDDVVIVEGEWGRIEEITQTYVVVRIWDLRRLVIPLNYFLENPFQNWTRTSAALLGTVFVYVDYTVPVEEIRKHFKTILDESGMWDGEAWGLQVTNTTDRTMELRALMSAPDASRIWGLRCHVREKLIEYIQQRWPGGLPRVRAQLDDISPQAAFHTPPESRND
jgi:small-conductance mechanosensitive channel